MKTHKSRRTRRLKVAGLALACIVAGAGSWMLRSWITRGLHEPARISASQPTTAPAAPHERTPSPEHVAAANMAGLLLMLSLLSFITGGICLGWIVWDIREARPAWKKQQKHPLRR